MSASRSWIHEKTSHHEIRQQNGHDETNQTVHQLALGLIVTMDAQQYFSSERCVQEIFLQPIKDLVLIIENFVGLFGSFFSPWNFIQDSPFISALQMPSGCFTYTVGLMLSCLC